MKNFSRDASGLLLLALGVTGYSGRKDDSASRKQYLFRMSVNTTDLVMGEK